MKKFIKDNLKEIIILFGVLMIVSISFVFFFNMTTAEFSFVVPDVDGAKYIRYSLNGYWNSDFDGNPLYELPYTINARVSRGDLIIFVAYYEENTVQYEGVGIQTLPRQISHAFYDIIVVG